MRGSSSHLARKNAFEIQIYVFPISISATIAGPAVTTTVFSRDAMTETAQRAAITVQKRKPRWNAGAASLSELASWLSGDTLEICSSSSSPLPFLTDTGVEERPARLGSPEGCAGKAMMHFLQRQAEYVQEIDARQRGVESDLEEYVSRNSRSQCPT
jgi:hypothetical protein